MLPRGMQLCGRMSALQVWRWEFALWLRTITEYTYTALQGKYNPGSRACEIPTATMSVWLQGMAAKEVSTANVYEHC